MKVYGIILALFSATALAVPNAEGQTFEVWFAWSFYDLSVLNNFRIVTAWEVARPAGVAISAAVESVPQATPTPTAASAIKSLGGMT